MPRRKRKPPVAPFPLAEVLKRLKVKRYQLFKRSGLRPQHLWRLAKPGANPNWHTIMRIVRALDCSLAQFDPKRN